MKRCQRCDLNFPDSLNLCEACGGALTEVASLRCPACGEASQPGWKFCVKCRSPLSFSDIGDLTNATERPTPPPTVPLVSPETSSTEQEEETTRTPLQETVSNFQIRVRCRSCRKLVDEDAVFCKYCGASMFEDPVSSRTKFPPASLPLQPPPSQATTVQPPMSVSQPAHDKTPPSLTMLEAYGSAPDTSRASFRWWHGLILLVFLLVMVGALGAGGWWWWSNRKPSAQATAPPNQNAGQSETNAANFSSPSSERKSGQMASEVSADDEVKLLQQRLGNANASDKGDVISTINKAENKYPNDYRFTYERAKLIGKGLISHDEAFDALYRAAQKAIDGGKAQAMLDGLMADKDGAFSRLSRGHRDWGVITQALSSKDRTALKGHAH